MPFSPKLFNRKTKKGVEDITKEDTPPPPPTSPNKVEAYLSPSSKSVPSYPAPTPPSTTGSLDFRREAARLERTLEGLSESESAPTWLKHVLQAVGPILVHALVLARKAAPILITLSDKWAWAQANLPVEVLVMCWGLTLCFFGGTFSLTLCAYEAFKISGWDTSRAAIEDLNKELVRYRSASIEDDKLDEDGDGVADVDQITQSDLVRRKVFLFLKVSDPNKVNDAISGLTQGAVGVVATLKFKHARTVALGVSIGNYLRKPAGIYLAPHIANLVPKEHRKWVPHVINYACKLIAVSVAWTISSIMSAVQCGVRGGLMFARAGLKYAKKRGIVDIDDEDTYLDEIVGWTVAVVGAGFQIMNGFGLPFPLNVLLLPFRLLEGYLRWIVTN